MSATELANIALFAGLPAAELEEMGRLSRTRRHIKGEVVFHKEDPAGALFVIRSGSVRISVGSADGKQLILAILGPGEFFGELSLLDGLPRSADAIANEACELLLLQRDAFTSFLDTHPRAAISLLASLSKQLRQTTDQLQDASFLDVPSRLARALISFAQDGKTSESKGIRLTQSQLAAVVGTSRESVNKWLSHYERRGIIRREKGVTTVLQLAALQKAVDPEAFV